MDVIENFLKFGCLGEVRLAQPIAEVHALLGSPECTGRLMRGWTIEAYADQCLQISYSKGIVGLIGIYFKPDRNWPPALPAAVKCDLPFSPRTTPEELEGYLKCNGIKYVPDKRLPDVVAFKIGAGAVATFDDDQRLNSLLLASKG